jgi:hypothetical protein
MEKKPEPVSLAHRGQPARQKTTVEVLSTARRSAPTPTFGTAAPPKGLSGALRRFAYGLPDHRAPKWMVLLLADRVNVLERRAGRLMVPAAIVVGTLLGAVTLRRRFV